ncbi:hypothetical protein G3B95_004467 [Salmonella enterica]|uniref:hypothetical protein n=1 Tax=Escherichia coli TaxID=562 RepID=UPI00128350A9|nr:hypothetical protein [Escherichia coli]EAQ0915734.1 hypothetical protein [Salmonella enterica]EBV2116349.1 hypothetical protein [Salmonella enterica subsp. enterica serovar Typhimurium]ECA9706091.1 hypothetical protein [Salmonella enterica subsp. enterica serovar Bredeney]EDG0419033.1 hypothetical protein [Salmonella enterica subsp. enterica serovar Infantis]EEB8214608.1 hypothetical protein [Salmonella enterica subsp. enterica serovar Enteritidis]EFX5205701.1 hypothetical protein [Shigell
MSNDNKVTLGDVKRSFFYFLAVFCVFILSLPGIINMAYLSTAMIILKCVLGIVLIVCVAANGSSFIEKLLLYIKNKSADQK